MDLKTYMDFTSSRVHSQIRLRQKHKKARQVFLGLLVFNHSRKFWLRMYKIHTKSHVEVSSESNNYT